MLLYPTFVHAATIPVYDAAKDLSGQESIRLIEPWALFRCRLLTPGLNADEPFHLTRTGVPWQKVSDQRCGVDPASFGYGTYAMRVKGLSPRADGYQIELKLAFSSYRMFVYPEAAPERVQQVDSGRVSEHEETMLPAYQTRFISLKPQHAEEVWVVLIQIANFQHHRGGLMQPPFLAPGQVLEREFHREVESTLACLGLMSFMMIYTLMLHLRRPEDRSSLMLSLTCLTFIARVIPTSNLIYYYAVDPPAWLFRLHFSIEYTALVACPTAYLLFVHYSFRAQSPRRWVQIFVGSGLALSLLNIFAPLSVFTGALAFDQGLIVVLGLCALMISVKAVRQRSEGAWLALVGDVVLAAFVVYDITMSSNLLPRTMYLTQYGACFFLFMQSQVLATRFAQAFRTAEKLQKELQSEVDRQTEELSSMMKNIPQGVFVITSEGRIQGNYSSHLETILGVSQLQGEPALDILFTSSLLTQEQRDLASSTLVAALSEDVLVWNLNASNLPREFIRQSRGEAHILELDWNPIVGRDQRVDRILVTVRDVTQVRALQEISRRQKTEFDMVLEIMQADRRTIVSFFELGSTILQDIQNILANARDNRSDMGRQVFLKLHTLKGLARSYGLSRLTTSIHEVEQNLVQSQRVEWVNWEPEVFRGSMREIQSVFEIYEKLLREKLGWTRDERTGHELSQEELLALQRCATASDWKGLQQSVQTLLDRHLLGDLQDVLQSFEKDLRSLALELEKATPRLVLRCDRVRVAQPMARMLRSSLLHLIRNSMDHGLETPEERRIMGKDPVGEISIDAHLDPEGLILMVEDDGRGLAIRTIQKLAMDKGLIAPDAHPGLQDVAALIFHPGFSTKREITELSGRGVGMDALRDAFVQAGGSFHIELLSSTPDAHGCIPFRMHGRLPARYFKAARPESERAAS